ncbi:MAG: methionine--tRNA ligase subunit beta [Planctomycetes bacterium]|nr:methionine--tRNA ligase subunit beta [Planctomycetota bacterium]
MEAATGIVQYEDFAKLDLRVGTIVEAGPHPNADKLLVLQVDLGTEKRQIIAGIRAYYEPAALLGRQIIVVANLAPRAMRGLDSQGMLLAASSADRTAVIFLTPERPIAAGSKVS